MQNETQPYVDTRGKGLKYDAGKLMFSLLTRGLAAPLRAVAAVLTYGALKYSAGSWQTISDGPKRYEDALDRHLNAWKMGEQFDDESGLHHLAHIACNALFLLWFQITGNRNIDYYTFRDPKALKENYESKEPMA